MCSLWEQEEQFQNCLPLAAGHLSARSYCSGSNRVGKFSTFVFLKAQRRLLRLGLLAEGALARMSHCLLEQLRGVTCNAGLMLGEQKHLESQSSFIGIQLPVHSNERAIFINHTEVSSYNAYT